MRAKRPYAEDWIDVGDDTQYSKHLEMWYKNGKCYDRLSANHNGITGAGAELKQIIKQANVRWL